MFGFVKNALSKIYQQVTSKLAGLFGRTAVDEATLKELEIILLSADTGVSTTRMVIENIKNKVNKGIIATGTDLKQALKEELRTILKPVDPTIENKNVFLLVGINGSGKTTCAAKLAHRFIKQGKKVLLAAADTFRAAAVDQLTTWAAKIGATIVQGNPGQDPASVIYQACEQFKTGGYDVLIIDTAGRLQSKANLMKELEKCKKTVQKQLPNAKTVTLLTIDGMLGQNSFEQAKLFHESTQLDGIILTKMDGSGKGGIVFGVAHQLGIPTLYISFGEGLEDIALFEPEKYLEELVEK